MVEKKPIKRSRQTQINLKKKRTQNFWQYVEPYFPKVKLAEYLRMPQQERRTLYLSGRHKANSEKAGKYQTEYGRKQRKNNKEAATEFISKRVEKMHIITPFYIQKTPPEKLMLLLHEIICGDVIVIRPHFAS